MNDLTSDIWARCVDVQPVLDLTTAEDRLRLDTALRAELAAIEDPKLRDHVAELLRGRRRTMFAPAELRADPSLLAGRVAAIEEYLGLAKAPRESLGPVELRGLRP